MAQHPLDKKVCNKCGIKKPLSDYHKHKIEKDGHCSICKVCRCEDSAEWRKNNPEKAKETYKKFGKKYQKNWRKENKDKSKIYQRKSKLKNKYGISLDDYNKMFKEQKGRCAICGTRQSEMKRALDIDHNHTTREVRSLLCSRRNLVVGNIEKNIDIINNVFRYLEENNVTSA